MTLYVMTEEHRDFLTRCNLRTYPNIAEARRRADDILDIAGTFFDPLFFVGPTPDRPKYYLGAFLDITGRAHLEVSAIGFVGASFYRDCRDWLGYMFDELGVKLIEDSVWVGDTKKEWLMRGLGFKKGGLIPDKLDIPGHGPVAALAMYIRAEEYHAADRRWFCDKLREHQRRERLRKSRSVANG
ncbi:MAG: hypothetical protein IPK63_15700 [Candidatus Competibacteraceae bacterium]|nr:hypothetical protein [Candidatus Competibacteraceae bacterium]MBK8184240.1 hypothetical protein [Candidatus Competibacteraceae bacterium]